MSGIIGALVLFAGIILLVSPLEVIFFIALANLIIGVLLIVLAFLI